MASRSRCFVANGRWRKMMAHDRWRRATIERDRDDLLSFETRWGGAYYRKIGLIGVYPVCKTDFCCKTSYKR